MSTLLKFFCHDANQKDIHFSCYLVDDFFGLHCHFSGLPMMLMSLMGSYILRIELPVAHLTLFVRLNFPLALVDVDSFDYYLSFRAKPASLVSHI
jgi:hypothetical protein